MKEKIIPVLAIVASVLTTYHLGVYSGSKTSVAELTAAYQKGRMDILKMRPVSWDLEMACVGLWSEKQPLHANAKD